MAPKSSLPDAADRPVYGTPRVPPYVLLCHADPNWCGRLWIANTWEEYERYTAMRGHHETLCAQLVEVSQQRTLILP